MRNAVLTGIGGQGTVLAAKVLAQAAQSRGWQVRTAETIGMAQRGGSVVSHVRMGDAGERVHAPLVPRGCADVLIAFEPGEAARVADLVRPDGVLVSASRAINPVGASLAGSAYEAAPVLDALAKAHPGRFVAVDETAVLATVGSAKALNMVLLAAAAHTGALGLSLDELKDAVRACVKPRFVEMNLAAMDAAVQALEA